MCTGACLDTTIPAAIDADRQAFAARLLDTINAAATALMLSVGHRAGLFDTLADGAPRTSTGLAAEAGLDERYVREWLAAMSVAGIVELEAATGRHRLPPAHAALLASAAPGQMAGMFQFIAVLGGVETRIVECFRHGGGVPYAAFERFHEVMAEESTQTVVDALDEHILPLVPGLHERLVAGIDVADLGCGQGRALLALAERYPASRFTGVDLCVEAVTAGIAVAQARGFANLEFIEADAAEMMIDARFDLVTTFDAIHDQAQPARVLANIRRMLRPGGVYLMQDINAQSDVAANRDHPLGPFMYTISTMHCMTVSLAQGGDGLGTAWGEQLALRMLADAGFASVTPNRLPHDIQNIFYVCR